ncbi:BRCT domain-containing protein At4g02110 isoform X1 [Corylus avellana]|uniref:BRCT domain-containing protein At4g02110 isoform X1 n=1 Tax=Corylus avellana TaxID=13451 RepID=UPI00286B9D18|nr:BRCT domain-containing protein At4g02110 isoform X1 [Corylus avellana]
MESNSPSTAFLDVRFVLFGFDPVNENKVRGRLVYGGGVDAGQYSQSCTHVIVDKLVYDDPVCIAARNDGKTLVTALWVDHSFDVGMPVDSTSIMYRPLKDLNGIPGAKNLVICLTGYQRQDRDDIMVMVSLMGARFSKPLVANKVTHLICYKFEGEKYELAKKVKMIKLVNHRWLEDCLRDWELLPEDNYYKSGYDLEMMEAEAKDSEEEAEDTTVKQFLGRNMNKSPHNSKIGVPTTSELPTSVGELSPAPKGPLNVESTTVMLFTPGKEKTSGQASSSDNVDVSKALGCQNTNSGELPDLLDQNLDPMTVDNGLTSTSRNGKRPIHSDATISPLSDSMKTSRRSSLPMYSGEMPGKLSDHSKAHLGEVSDDFENFPFRAKAKDSFGSGCLQTSREGTDLVHGKESSGLLPQKRMANATYVSFKSPKVSIDSKPCTATSPVAGDKTQGLEPTFLIDGPHGASSHFLLGNDGLRMDKTPNLNAAQTSNANISTTEPSTCSKKSLTSDVPSSETVTAKNGQDNDAYEKTPQSSFQRLRQPALSTKPDIVDLGMGKSALEVGEKGEPENEQQQDIESSAIKKKLATEKSDGPCNASLPGGNDNLITQPLRKKTVAKKTLGSRPKSTANIQKGPVYVNKTTSHDAAAIHSDEVKKTADHEKSPPTVNTEALKEVQTENVMKSGDYMENRNESMGDETEAPENKVEDELEKPLNEQKPGVVILTDKADTIMEENLEMVQHITNDYNTSMHDDAMASEEGANGIELEKTVCHKNVELASTSLDLDGLKGKVNKGKKRPIGRTKMKMDVMKSKKVVDGEGSGTENNEGTGTEKEKRVLLPSGKTKSCPVLTNESENRCEGEKENKPVKDLSQGKECVRKPSVKSNIMPRKINQKAGKVNQKSSTSVGEYPYGEKTEPTWFILSAHRLQRKEFQQVIRRLKGRLCRDSHQWSYQATHLITTDPIRRTEKFFAAAASGRWILKTDYLTACSQAGRFVAEEPYEWHKNGLSEDGAINLEAPRKWRLLRKRTGHGAFYGMRVIIYGECIAPPLDTLKRAVKAGDGTLLATSPPYSRFFKSGVDFAIISPGMPRVDLWVQEFLKHEIPCVAADYLVEYVCKPGYSLERHVLYNTNAWAEKSFASLQSKGEEIVEDLTPPDDHGSNDIACQVCGSCDRGEVMLICGDESGSVGCGVGTHIDCCDPPLQGVPEDDWFCAKCSQSRHSTTSGKK